MKKLDSGGNQTEHRAVLGRPSHSRREASILKFVLFAACTTAGSLRGSYIGGFNNYTEV